MLVNKRFISLLIACSLLALCSGDAAAQEARAAVIEKSQVVSYSIPSDLTEDEQYWFVKFQEGNMFADGWRHISETILEKTADSERAKQRALLHGLGEKIGLEWCKDNKIRKIDTSRLKVWGSKLKKTAKKDPEKLGMVLASIDKEVDTLLD